MLTSAWGLSVVTSAWPMLTSALTKSMLTKSAVGGAHGSVAPPVSHTLEADVWVPSVSKSWRKKEKDLGDCCFMGQKRTGRLGLDQVTGLFRLTEMGWLGFKLIGRLDLARELAARLGLERCTGSGAAAQHGFGSG